MQNAKCLYWLVFILALLLSSCSSHSSSVEQSEEMQKELEEKTIQALLDSGMDDYSVGKYYTALEDFEELLDRYPFSREAATAELKAADCSYYMRNYEEAFVRYESVEEKHPSDESAPYVMFQKAMCYYNQISKVQRDSSCAQKAVRLFRQLINAFPDSVYTPQAKEKLRISREFLANHELSIAQFYLRIDERSQAEARLRYLIATYPETGVASESRDILVVLEQQRELPRKPRTLLGHIFDEKTEKESEK